MKKILQLFGKENSLRGASLILVITLMCSNILGLLRDRFLARNISFSDLDTYFAAFRIPDTIFNFLVLGAITSAFIPVFSEYLAKDKQEEAHRIANSLINVAAVLMGLSALAFFFLMPTVTRLVVPDFDPDRLHQTVTLSRILMLTPIFFSISYIIGSVLNSYKRFLAYSLSPLLYNLSIIVGALWAAPRFGVIGVAYFVVIGSLLHILVQLPALLRVGFKFEPVMDLKNGALKKIGLLMVPRSISLGMGQVLLTILTALSSSLVPGAIAAFNFSNNIQTVPTVVLGSSLATAIFPTLSAAIARNDRKAFIYYLTKTIRAIGYLLIPSSVIFVLLRAQIIRLILGSGKVGWGDTKLTALTLGCFSISLIAQGLVPLLARAFFAMKNTRLPMYAAIIFVITSAVIAAPLSRYYSVPGMALSFSIGNFVYAGILFVALRKDYPEIINKELVWSYSKIIGISFIMGIIMRLSLHGIAPFVDMTRFVGVFIQTGLTMLIGITTYLLLSHVLGFEEMKWALRRKIPSQAVQEMTTEEAQQV